jgi:hypothetical protein
MKRVILTNEERRAATQLGCRRHAEAVAAGRPDAHGFIGSEGLRMHIEGAMGEIAAARALGVEFTPTCNTFKDPDLPYGIQVRTRSRHDYDLIVRDDDADAEMFVLVTGSNGSYVVHGWMLGDEAKQDRWRRMHGGRPAAYFVPKNELRPLGTLVDLITFWSVTI